MATTLRHSISATSSSDRPKIKQHVASYHTTTVIAHKANYSKLHPKIGCHGNVPQHSWTPSNTIPWAHLSPQPKRHLDRFGCFCTDDRRVSLYFTMGRPFPLKIALSPRGSGAPSNAWFSGPTRVLNPNCISIGSGVFARLTIVTDRPTDHATRWVTIGRMYVLSTAIRPNNNNDNENENDNDND